jgi:1,4-alpha-glucan branching enzyme
MEPSMLSEAEVQALVQARHADPFALLGMHTGADGALWMRALLPGAAAVTLHEYGGRKVVALEPRHADGLW